MESTYLPTDRAALHRAYWPARHYWRELADQGAPHLSARDLVRAARILHAVAIADQIITSDGTERGKQSESDAGRSALELAMRDVLATRQVSNPLDVACRAAAIALENVSTYRTGDRGRDPRWVMPGAPDGFEGTRHQTTSKRSNSGRTQVKVNRAGVAPVIGRADRQASTFSTVMRQTGAPVLAPVAWRSLAPTWKLARRIVERVGDVPTVPAMPALHASVHLHLIEWAPRRASGKNALYVMARTSALYGVGMVSDLTEHQEVTPDLTGMDVRGIAVHRGDMSGQTGVLALTATLNNADTARQRPRERLATVRTLKSDADRVGLVTSADDSPRVIRERVTPEQEREMTAPGAFPTRERLTYSPRANHAPDHRLPYSPPVWFIVASDGTCEANGAPRVWLGHSLVKRGEMATSNHENTRGNRERRTIGKLTVDAFTVATVETIAADLEHGERIVITTNDGAKANVNRANDGRYSATVYGSDGTRVNPKPFRTRTVDAIARKVVMAAS